MSAISDATNSVVATVGLGGGLLGLAYDAANGTLHFYLPPEAKGIVSVTINAPGGMPIQRPAEKTNQPNVYKVSYPIKPGETRFDVS